MTSPGDTTVPLPGAEDLSATMGEWFGEQVYDTAVTYPGDASDFAVRPAVDADPVEAIRDPRLAEAMEMLAKALSYRRWLIWLTLGYVLAAPVILAGWAVLIIAIVVYVRFRQGG